MKGLVIAFGLVFVPALMAQPQEGATSAPEPSQTTRSTSSNAAPKLGHALDPADVDVLTGKDKPKRSSYGGYAYGASAYMYGYGYARSPSIAADVTTKTSSPVSLAISRRGRAAIVIGNAPFGGLLRAPRVCSRGVFGRGGLF